MPVPSHPLDLERFYVRKDFLSQYLSAPRSLRVYLPPAYRNTRRRFPVLYFQDGQNLFQPETAFLGRCWNLHVALDSLATQKLMEPVIAVGIDNAGEERIDEYTPTRDATMGYGGKAVRYGRMLVREIKPWIDSNYRTLPQADFTGVGGSSLGGLVSLYLALRYPRIFGKAAVMSPSVWWNSRAILDYGQKYRGVIRPRIWLDVGDQEGSRPEQAIADARVLRTVLVHKGWQEGRELKYVEAMNAGHDEAAWAHRAPRMLQFLFPTAQVRSETGIW